MIKRFTNWLLGLITKYDPVTPVHGWYLPTNTQFGVPIAMHEFTANWFDELEVMTDVTEASTTTTPLFVNGSYDIVSIDANSHPVTTNTKFRASYYPAQNIMSDVQIVSE